MEKVKIFETSFVIYKVRLIPFDTIPGALHQCHHPLCSNDIISVWKQPIIEASLLLCKATEMKSKTEFYFAYFKGFVSQRGLAKSTSWDKLHNAI